MCVIKHASSITLTHSSVSCVLSGLTSSVLVPIAIRAMSAFAHQ